MCGILQATTDQYHEEKENKKKNNPQNKEKDNTKGEKVFIETQVTHICNKGTLGMEMKL